MEGTVLSALKVFFFFVHLTDLLSTYCMLDTGVGTRNTTGTKSRYRSNYPWCSGSKGHRHGRRSAALVVCSVGRLLARVPRGLGFDS